MADITYTESFIISKGGAYETSNSSGTSFTDTMTGTHTSAQTLLLTSSYVALDKGSIGTIGHVCIRSLSSSSLDVCSVSLDSGATEHMVIPYGGILRFKMNSTTVPKLKYSAGAVHQVQYWMAEK